MKINKFLQLGLALISIYFFTACSSDDDSNKDNSSETAEEQYVIASSDSENAYLLTTTNIEDGSISAQNSLQVIGDPSWYFANDVAAYGFIYRQGDPGTTQSFGLNEEGELKKRNEIDFNVSIQSKGMVDDEIYVEYSSRNHEEPEATFYIINPLTQGVNGPITINTEELANNGEYAYITAVTGYKDKVLVGFRTIKAGSDGDEDNLFGSDFNDHTNIAVFNKELELENVIEDSGRTGIIAGQSRATAETGIEPVENGDVYVFSSALDAENVPSGILKIKDGNWDFDEDYFFDISDASGGYKLYRTYYAGNDKFVVQMFTDANTASASPEDTRNKFAVVDVKTEDFTWVDGVPNGILNIGEPYADKSNGEVVFPIETDGYPKLYSVDVESAQMNEGLEIKAEGVKGIGKLRIQE